MKFLNVAGLIALAFCEEAESKAEAPEVAEFKVGHP